MQEQLLREILDELRQINTRLALLPQLLTRPFEVEIVDRARQRDQEELKKALARAIAGHDLPPNDSPAPTTRKPPPMGPAAPLAVETLPRSDMNEIVQQVKQQIMLDIRAGG